MFSLKSMSSFLTFAVFIISIISNSYATDNEVIKGSLCWAWTTNTSNNQKKYGITFFDNQFKEVKYVEREASPFAKISDEDVRKMTDTVLDQLIIKQEAYDKKYNALFNAMLDPNITKIEIKDLKTEWMQETNAYHFGLRPPKYKDGNNWFLYPGLSFLGSFPSQFLPIQLSNHKKDDCSCRYISNGKNEVSFTLVDHKKETSIELRFTKEMIDRINSCAKATLKPQATKINLRERLLKIATYVTAGAIFLAPTIASFLIARAIYKK